MAASVVVVGSPTGLILPQFVRLEEETTIYEGETPCGGAGQTSGQDDSSQHILGTLTLPSLLSLA